MKKEVLKGVFHRVQNIAKTDAEADGSLDRSRDRVQNLGDCCLHVAN